MRESAEGSRAKPPDAWFTGPTALVAFSGASYVLAGVFLVLSLLVFAAKVAKPSPREVERMHSAESAGGP